MDIKKVRALLAPQNMNPSTDAHRATAIAAAILEVAEGIDEVRRMLTKLSAPPG